MKPLFPLLRAVADQWHLLLPPWTASSTILWCCWCATSGVCADAPRYCIGCGHSIVLRDLESGLIVFDAIVCECAASVNRIMQIFGPPVFWVTVLHTIGKINHHSLCCSNPSYVVMTPSLVYIPTAGGTGAASQGTLNAFVYGLTPSVRSAGAEILRGYGLCLPRHEFARTETSSSNAPATSAKSAAVDDSESAHPVAVADSFR